jgi:predicted DNA-binding transcriptional regulator AlpA
MMQEPTFRYIDRAEVCRLRGIGKTRQFQDEKDGKFPAGERHGLRIVRWRSDVVARWMDAESERVQGQFSEIAERASQIARVGVEAKRKKRMSSTELAGQA